MLYKRWNFSVARAVFLCGEKTGIRTVSLCRDLCQLLDASTNSLWREQNLCGEKLVLYGTASVVRTVVSWASSATGSYKVTVVDTDFVV